MASKLSRVAYKKLIEQDLEWLDKLDKKDRTLEKQHVECIVRESEFFNYELAEFLESLVRECGPDSKIGETTYQKLKEFVHELTGPYGA